MFVCGYLWRLILGLIIGSYLDHRVPGHEDYMCMGIYTCVFLYHNIVISNHCPA
jgi:hypothetical protein